MDLPISRSIGVTILFLANFLGLTDSVRSHGKLLVNYLSHYTFLLSRGVKLSIQSPIWAEDVMNNSTVPTDESPTNIDQASLADCIPRLRHLSSIAQEDKPEKSTLTIFVNGNNPIKYEIEAMFDNCAAIKVAHEEIQRHVDSIKAKKTATYFSSNLSSTQLNSLIAAEIFVATRDEAENLATFPQLLSYIEAQIGYGIPLIFNYVKNELFPNGTVEIRNAEKSDPYIIPPIEEELTDIYRAKFESYLKYRNDIGAILSFAQMVVCVIDRDIDEEIRAHIEMNVCNELEVKQIRAEMEASYLKEMIAQGDAH